MANDRLIMECRRCGEVITLARYSPAHGLVSVEGGVDPIRFIERHSQSCLAIGGFDLGKDPLVGIANENAWKPKVAE